MRAGSADLSVRRHTIVGLAPDEIPGRSDDEEVDPSARARRRIGDWVARTRAADLARYPDARWTSLRDRLGAGFSPPRELLDAEGGGAAAARWRAWQTAAERYGRTGNLFASGRILEPPGIATAQENAPRDPLRGGAAVIFEIAATMDREPIVIARLVTIVAIEQDERGEVTRVRVVHASGSAAHDRLALDGARGVRGGPGLDLPHVARTEWTFTSELVAEPPSPALGFGFDATFRRVRARGPAWREVRTRVEIVAVRAPERG